MSWTRKRIVVGTAAALLAASVATGALAAPGDGVLDTTLMSRASGAAGAVGDAKSVVPAISAGGRFVVFTSEADNLDPDSNDNYFDTFVRDAQSGATTLVSRATGAGGAVGDAGSYFGSISADGRYVAFESDADNLDGASNDSFGDVFVRDTQTNTTTLISRATGAAGVVGDDNSASPSISVDGRYVAFQSFADNLDPDSNDAVGDVFVRDTQANTTTLVSRASAPASGVGDNYSFGASISADGRFVAFISGADNIDPDSDDAVDDVFVRDVQTSTTHYASRATGVGGTIGGADSSGPSISADGRYVAFSSDADDIDPDSNDNVSDIFVRDIQSVTTTLVSRAPGVVADGDSGNPSISANGQIVAFVSDADNLDPDSNDAVFDVLVRDIQAGTTTLASRATGAAGAPGDGASEFPAISADGSSVAYHSDADNLDADSNDAVIDMFLRELSDPLVAPPGPIPITPITPTKECKKGKKLKRGKCVKKKGKKKRP